MTPQCSEQDDVCSQGDLAPRAGPSQDCRERPTAPAEDELGDAADGRKDLGSCMHLSHICIPVEGRNSIQAFLHARFCHSRSSHRSPFPVPGHYRAQTRRVGRATVLVIYKSWSGRELGTTDTYTHHTIWSYSEKVVTRDDDSFVNRAGAMVHDPTKTTTTPI